MLTLKDRKLLEVKPEVEKLRIMTNIIIIGTAC